MEHVAYRLGKDPANIKKLNLYKKGQVTVYLSCTKMVNMLHIFWTCFMMYLIACTL